MSAPARWYCPPGVAKPAHACVPGTCALLPHAGPDSAPPGGTVYGGIFEAGETGWMPHPSGHWFNLEGVEPALLIRLDADPRLITWREIGGALPHHIWRVPAILTPRRDDGGQIHLFTSALDRIWTGQDWHLPQHLADLQRRLLQMHFSVGTGAATLVSAEAVSLAIDLLALGHQIDPFEVTSAGWVSEVVVLRTLLAAVDLEPA